METAYAVRRKASKMWLSSLPGTFGHWPYHAPILFASARDAENIRQILNNEPCEIVVIEWRTAETIGGNGE